MKKKLILNKETIRSLQESELVAATGGDLPPGGTTAQCPLVYYGNLSNVGNLSNFGNFGLGPIGFFG